MYRRAAIGCMVRRGLGFVFVCMHPSAFLDRLLIHLSFFTGLEDAIQTMRCIKALRCRNSRRGCENVRSNDCVYDVDGDGVPRRTPYRHESMLG
jgi:hypothetical protein